jgi:hypothetical protein
MADEEEGTRGGPTASHVDEYVRLVDGSERDDSSDDANHHHQAPRQQAAASSSSSPPALNLPHMARLYRACVVGNVLSLALVATLAAAAVRYYPKIPEYNICNDSVAWSSLIQSLTSLQATADFEILASVSNLNHFDIYLDRGTRGTFSHNGVRVGTFDVPPVRAAATSVTDVLVVAHLAPEKWEALSLAAEYYRGDLVLDVDVSARVRVPALLGFATSVTLQGIEVQVNELSDRHLCACEDWDSARNHTGSGAGAAAGVVVGAVTESGVGEEPTGDSAAQPEPTEQGSGDAAGDESTASAFLQEANEGELHSGVSVETM